MNRVPRLTPSEREALNRFVRQLDLQYPARVRSVILFGSKARGDSGPDSDVDVLVTLADDDPDLRSDVRRLAARISLEFDLLLSVRAISRSRWSELARYRFPLYQAIEADGIKISGN